MSCRFLEISQDDGNEGGARNRHGSRLLPLLRDGDYHYTGGVVRLRFFTLVLALLVAATPVIGVVCEMDCDRPTAASPRCHQSNVPHDGVTLRDVPHACHHDHTSGRPAFLTSASGRDAVGTSFGALTATLVPAILAETHAAACGALHGPPGRRTSPHITVLRI